MPCEHIAYLSETLKHIMFQSFRQMHDIVCLVESMLDTQKSIFFSSYMILMM